MNTSAKKIITWGIFIFFILIIVSYAFFTSKDLIFGVKIKDVNLVDGEKVTEEIVEVSGNAKNATELHLNGRLISTDQDKNFNETIALLPGYNVINLTATDKFGNVDVKNYQLIYSN
jgi:hypothetical protein